MDGSHERLFDQSGVVLGKRLREDGPLLEELTYCVPIGLPHSQFQSWSDEDQDKALAFRRRERSLCPGCGTSKEEWRVDPDAYLADVEVCHGCERVELENENDVAKAKGAKVGLLPRDVAMAKLELQLESGELT